MVSSKKFISCDWGTSSFRLRLVDAESGEVMKEKRSDKGIATTHAEWIKAGLPEDHRISFYKKVLTAALKDLTDKPYPIIISGMASSSIGMKELPYQLFPFRLTDDLLIHKIEPYDNNTSVMYVVSGMRTASDIMRGEETMLVGIGDNDGSQICILPGTHSKHVFIENGVAIDFKTYMTGELFGIIEKHSVLSKSLQPGEDTVSFERGVRDSMDGNIMSKLFGIRAGHILNNRMPTSNYQYLSGLLIGNEVKDLKKFSPGNFILICDEPLSSLYKNVFEIFETEEVSNLSATSMIVEGHRKIMKHIEG